MKLEDLQSYISGLVSASTALAGVPVIIEQFEDSEQNATLQDHLNVKGVCIAVREFSFQAIEESESGGAVRYSVSVPIVCYRNKAVSTNGTTGVNITAESMTEAVMSATFGKPAGAVDRLKPGEPLFVNEGFSDGVHVMTINTAFTFNSEPT